MTRPLSTGFEEPDRTTFASSPGVPARRFRLRPHGAAALAAILGLSACWLPHWPAGASEAAIDGRSGLRTRELSYGYRLRNTGAGVRSGLQFRTYAPIARTAYQRTERVESNLPYSLSTDALGNRILRFDLDPIPPFGTRVIELRALLSTAALPRESPLSDADRYLEPETQVEADHPRILEIAAPFRDRPPLDRARGLYRWVVANLRRTSYRPRSRGALGALQSGSGDCTEYAQLYAALARAAGIPTRVMAGYRHRDTARLRTEDLHNWAEVHLDAAWRVVDPHGQRFLEDEQQYIAMAVLGRPQGQPLSGHQRIHSTDAEVAVEML